jgi:DNA-binding response OmpR family regulator
MPAEKSNKILIVEDDDTYRNDLKDMLSQNGHMVIPALDGEQAIESILSFRPGLVLLDLLLPRLQGLEVLRRIRSYPDAEISEIPVIVLSNFSNPADMTEANKLGIAAYFVKSHTSQATILQQVNLLLGADRPVDSFQKNDAPDFTNITYS